MVEFYYGRLKTKILFIFSNIILLEIMVTASYFCSGKYDQDVFIEKS